MLLQEFSMVVSFGLCNFPLSDCLVLCVEVPGADEGETRQAMQNRAVAGIKLAQKNYEKRVRRMKSETQDRKLSWTRK
jgi:hypothetical protein